jgi:WD40 repeat protein
MELGDGEIVAMAVKEAVFDPVHAEEEHTLEGHTTGVECIVVYGDKLLSGSQDSTIKVWSTDTWACERTLEGHGDAVNRLIVHGNNLISGSGDNTIKIWGS